MWFVVNLGYIAKLKYYVSIHASVWSGGWRRLTREGERRQPHVVGVIGRGGVLPLDTKSITFLDYLSTQFNWTPSASVGSTPRGL